MEVDSQHELCVCVLGVCETAAKPVTRNVFCSGGQQFGVGLRPEAGICRAF